MNDTGIGHMSEQGLLTVKFKFKAIPLIFQNGRWIGYLFSFDPYTTACT